MTPATDRPCSNIHLMPETHKSKRFEAFRFKRSLNVADNGYLSMEANYTCPV
jgi:hypothetical protein